jgi:hypothetical protein
VHFVPQNHGESGMIRNMRDTCSLANTNRKKIKKKKSRNSGPMMIQNKMGHVFDYSKSVIRDSL